MQEGMEDLSMQFFTYLRASLAVTVKRRPVKREYRPPYSRFTVPRASVQSSTRRRNIKTASLHGAHEFPFFSSYSLSFYPILQPPLARRHASTDPHAARHLSPALPAGRRQPPPAPPPPPPARHAAAPCYPAACTRTELALAARGGGLPCSNFRTASSNSGRDRWRRRWPGRALHGWNLAGLRRDQRLKGARGAEISATNCFRTSIGRVRFSAEN
jgi:hypothetical protein